MKWIANRCRQRRQDITLLAAGALGEEEKSELEHHLAACEECRRDYEDLKTLTAPLADWEKPLSPVETTPAARMRWARAVGEAGGPNSLHQSPRNNFWRILWRELIWPSRRAWAGMAALWTVLLAINGLLSDHQMEKATASSMQDMAQVWAEQNQVLAELIGSAMSIPAAPPVIAPGPRSEREQRQLNG